MPELPEVETVMRGLAPVLEGRRLTRVLQRRPDLRIPFPRGFAKRLQGRRVERLSRRSKYLLLHMEGDLILISHLGMSGRFTIVRAGSLERASCEDGREAVTGADAKQKPGAFIHKAAEAGDLGNGPHDHVVFETDDGARVVYTDHRRFGLMTLCKASEFKQHKMIAGLGPEPLSNDFDAQRLLETFSGKRSPLKAGLLDQRVVAGLGNIYVCEALYRAKLSPERLCLTLKPAEAKRLVMAVKTVLAEAIESGGSTLRDYAGADGSLGYFQHRFSVYGRAGEQCARKGCGTVERIVQSGRSTFYCPKCQK